MWIVWVERVGSTSVTSHYSTKQVLSSPIFQLQQQNAADRSFGYSSLEVHMANMIMTVTDRIKVTFTDGGWQHLFCSLNHSLSHFSAPIIQKKCAMAIIFPIARCLLIIFLLLPCFNFQSSRRILKKEP